MGFRNRSPDCVLATANIDKFTGSFDVRYALVAYVTALPEHFGADFAPQPLDNTRTITTISIIRLLFWNFNYHTAHHMYRRFRSIHPAACTAGLRITFDIPSLVTSPFIGTLSVKFLQPGA